MRVSLCVPPYALADQPALGASILKAGCEVKSINTQIDYASTRLSTMLGDKLYFLLSSAREHPFLGELTFSPYSSEFNKTLSVFHPFDR